MIYFIYIVWHIWYYKTAATVLNIIFSHPVHWDLFFKWRNNPFISLSKLLVIKLHIIVISLLWTRRMKLGTWLCNDGRIRRPRLYTWKRAVAITAVAFVSPVVVSDEQLYPFLLASCPMPPASLLMCSVQSPDRSTYPDPVQPELYPPDFQLIPPPQIRVFCLLDYQEVSDSISQFPRDRLVLLLVLKLSNMWAAPSRSEIFVIVAWQWTSSCTPKRPAKPLSMRMREKRICLLCVCLLLMV